MISREGDIWICHKEIEILVLEWIIQYIFKLSLIGYVKFIAFTKSCFSEDVLLWGKIRGQQGACCIKMYTNSWVIVIHTRIKDHTIEYKIKTISLCCLISNVITIKIISYRKVSQGRRHCVLSGMTKCRDMQSQPWKKNNSAIVTFPVKAGSELPYQYGIWALSSYTCRPLNWQASEKSWGQPPPPLRRRPWSLHIYIYIIWSIYSRTNIILIKTKFAVWKYNVMYAEGFCQMQTYKKSKMFKSRFFFLGKKSVQGREESNIDQQNTRIETLFVKTKYYKNNILTCPFTFSCI